MVYARTAKRLDDLSLSKKGRKDTICGFIIGMKEAREAIVNDEGSTGREGREGAGARLPYGFVNMMSDAPSVQRIVCERRYIRAGRIPHVRGSSSLEESHI